MRSLAAVVAFTFLIVTAVSGQGTQAAMTKTRLHYRLDFKGAKRRMLVPLDVDPDAVMRQTFAVLQRRLGPLCAGVHRVGREGLHVDVRHYTAAKLTRIRGWIEQHGSFEMRIVADDTSKKCDIEEEKRRLAAWLEVAENAALARKDPSRAIGRFHRLSAAEGGRKSGRSMLRWAPVHRRIASAKSGSEPRFLPLDTFEKTWFGLKDLDAKSIVAASDPQTGKPVIQFRLEDARRSVYSDFSATNLGRKVAILINGSVRVAPVFRSRINGAGQISGGFTRTQANDLVRVLRSGSLPVVPELVKQTALPTGGRSK